MVYSKQKEDAAERAAGRKPMKGKKPCPRIANKGMKNDESWYTREGVPMVGCNFAALQTLDAEYITGLVTEAIVHYDVALIPPVDGDPTETQSIWNKMAEFYTEIRESNSGAANYSTGVVYAYVLNVMALHAIAYDLCKKVVATAENDVNAEMSASIKSVAAGNYSYRAMAQNYADRFNDLMLLLKEIEVLPVVPFAAMDRLRHYFGQIFVDSPGSKPAYINFHPATLFRYEAEYNKANDHTTINCVAKYFDHSEDPDSWQDEVDFARTILGYITGDSVMTILRGDIRRAFGDACMRTGTMTSLLSSGLKVAPLDAATMSKLENATVLGLFPGFNAANIKATVDGDSGSTEVRLSLAGVDDPAYQSRADKESVLINWHGNAAPTAAELCAITRLMTVAHDDNALGHSDWVIDYSDGFVLYDQRVVTKATMDSVELVPLPQVAELAQDGNVGSLRDLAFFLSVVDHSPQYFTTADPTPRGYIWDIDNFAILDKSTLATITSRVIRSLYSVHVPRGPYGRIEKAA